MTQYAPAKRIHSFHPPQRTLMGPGPTEIHPRVLTTMSQPAIGYLDPVFVEMMEELKSLLRYVYQTKNPLTFPLSGPGLGRHGVLLRQPGGARRQGDRVPERRVRRPHARERDPLRRHAGRGRGQVGRAGRPAEARGRAEEEPGREGRRLRARRDVHRLPVGREGPHADRAQARRAGDRRRRDLARRHAGEGGRVGDRRHLLREPEVPVVHAGAVAGVVLRARGRAREERARTRSTAGSWT